MTDVYPINEYGPLMPGLVMAAVAIVHVFLAQFAVGGGILLCYFQWLAMTGREPHARTFVDGYFKALVLISFVVGALTGVAIWFTAIQVSPATIGLMVENFHWLWAAEWTFFCVEIVSGYCFYRYHSRLDDKSAMKLLVIYSVSSWMSLCLINGILAWQLTPGRWLETNRLMDGFLNPSFWPSLFFRTIVALTLASLAACVMINLMKGPPDRPLDRAGRESLIQRTARLLMPMILMPVLGVWYLAVMPEDSRGWITGGSAAMSLFLFLSIGMSLLIGGYALIGLVLQKLYINGATATLLLALAFLATAGGEFVREGSRKPYSIRGVLYSNAIRPGEIAVFRRQGLLANDPYPLRSEDRFPTPQLQRGARVYRRQCAICHTLDGANALLHLAGHWDDDQKRLNIAKLQHTKTFMPPFAGTPRELEALVQLLRWTAAGKPPKWPASEDRETLEQIQQWLEEAGSGSKNQKQPTISKQIETIKT